VLRFPVAHPLILLSIVCAPRGRPTLQFESLGVPLTMAEWGALRSAIDEAWQALDLLCTCGHSFVEHARSSPHPCYVARGCPCRIFTAAEPLYLEEASE
jgi:hypothetical protein